MEPLSTEAVFDYPDGSPHFHGLPVVEESVSIGGRTFRLWGLKDAADLLDHQEFARAFIEEDRAPYGLELWPAAPMLAAAILEGEPGDARSALDLGCGLGLVSMAATLAGWRVIAADHDPAALQFARYNLDRNRLTVEDYTLLDWHRPPSGRRYDRIFGADVLYQRTDHAPIARCVAQLLAPDGTALLADPNRGVADAFEETARETGLDVSTMPIASPFRTRGTIQGRLFRLKQGPQPAA